MLSIVRTLPAIALFVYTSSLAAQQRELQRYPLESAEGRLMGFYSSALAATPLGLPLGVSPSAWSIELAIEFGYIPHLDSRQRSAGFDKPEASNLSPVLPRPRIAIALPGEFVLDANWLPPFPVVDATGNLFGASLRRAVSLGAVTLVPRLSFLDGRAEGAITCATDLGSGSVSDRQYYAFVCHSHESEDYFEPSHLAFDVTWPNGPHLLRAGSYATLGVRRERTRFDIGVLNSDGTRNIDHPVLEMEATRAFGSAGLQWGGGDRRSRFAAELFYTPGSLLTVRLLGGWRIK